MNIDGILLFNKSIGISSNKALQQVKRLYGADKAGHTGTLDPLATGLLPICFGEATKFTNYMLNAEKEYIATIKLGEVTTTYDSEGEITARLEVTCSDVDIKDCLANFVGTISQIPPLYSALKVNGRALYDYARNNQAVELKPRLITVHELELLECIGDNTKQNDNKNILVIRVLVSKGTYIRSLAHDIGRKLKCGAHLIGLVRTQVGSFRQESATDFATLSTMTDRIRQEILLPVDAGLRNCCIAVNLTESQYQRIKHGHECAHDVVASNSAILQGEGDMVLSLYFASKFLGVATFVSGVIRPLRLIDSNRL